MEKAPLYNDMAEGPANGSAYWLTTEDGIRIRAAFWPGGTKGTVLIFPGRTEYVEKYGLAAASLKERGFASISIDWRGQGLTDRMDPLRTLGHVDRFSDYQKDVRAVLAMAKVLGAPRPYYLMAHSMGGCIGLRALHESLPVKAAVFSAPMWGISLSRRLRPIAWAGSWLVRGTKYGRLQAPSTNHSSYVLTEPAQDNVLTSDHEMFAYMQRHMIEVPDLILGGPSLQWLYEALLETRQLRAMTPPPVPTITFLGTNERVVDTAPIHALMAKWKNGELRMVEGAEHEVPIEKPQIRDAFFDAAAELYTR